MGYKSVRNRVIPPVSEGMLRYRASLRHPRTPPVLDEGQEMVRGLTGEVQPVPRYTPPGAERVVFTRKKRLARRREWCGLCNRYVSARKPHDDHYPALTKKGIK
jgi:hypothetical protein